MTDLAFLDTALRGGAVALFVLVAALALRDGGRLLAARLGAAMSAGAAAYVVCSAPGHHDGISPWMAPVVLLCVGNATVFWLFTRAVFDDSFRLRPWHVGLWCLLASAPLLRVFGGLAVDSLPSRMLEVVGRAAPPAMAMLALVQTARDWRSDLVEGRRRLRLVVLAVAAGHILVVAFVELLVQGGRVPAALDALNALALASIATLVAAIATRADLSAILGGMPLPVATSPTGSRPVPAEPDDALDPALLTELDRLMAVERLYRHEGLTVGALASRVGVSERRLRRHVNQGLGYRNFNDYLNRNRIADAKLALADSGQDDVPILTIAMDAGFQSLGPFNRAFKADTGLTPTEFRRKSRSEPA